MVDLQGWLTLVACTGLLGLAVLMLLRGGRSPLAVPLALLCLVFFSWNLATLAWEVSGERGWRYLDVASSPLTAPVAFHFVATYLGKRRELDRTIKVIYASFGLLGLLGVLGFASDWAARFAGSSEWALLHLLMAVVVIAYAVVLLWRHLVKNRDPMERTRTRLLLASVVIGTILGLTELLADLGTPVPRGGHLAALATVSVLAVVALRYRLFEDDFSTRSMGYALAIGALAVISYLAIFYYLADSTAMLVLATATTTMAALVAMRQLVLAIAVERQRVRELAVLGSFSAQMAHDLRNPLAALKGAMQLLRVDDGRAQHRVDRAEFFELLLEQVDRIEGVLQQYGRLGRLEPELACVDVNALVRDVVALQACAVSSAVRIQTCLAEGLPTARADGELLTTALENLIRNACEAMPEGGVIEVETGKGAGLRENGLVRIEVRDEGVGMDVRALERAFDDFFTTKARGSGLGLSFVRRMAEAHGGRAWIERRERRGTRVVLELPVANGGEHGA